MTLVMGGAGSLPTHVAVASRTATGSFECERQPERGVTRPSLALGIARRGIPRHVAEGLATTSGAAQRAPTSATANMPRVKMARVRLIRRRSIHRGKVIELVQETLEIHGRRFVRETVLHPGAVVMVPMLDRSRIVFVRQYRRSIDREILELPAGTVSPGEPLAVCAQRELEEEIGYRAKRLTKLGHFYAAPGFCSERMTVFLAQGLTPVNAHPEPDELLRPVILSLKDALRKARTGAICDAKSLLGLFWVARILRKAS